MLVQRAAASATAVRCTCSLPIGIPSIHPLTQNERDGRFSLVEPSHTPIPKPPLFLLSPILSCAVLQRQTDTPHAFEGATPTFTLALHARH